MQLSARIQAVIKMFELFFELHSPFDIIMAKFFKNNRWIGSHDRHEIAEFAYAMFRKFEKLKFFTSSITSNFARFYVISFLKIENKLSPTNIDEIFSGQQSAPDKLNAFEKKFVDSVDINVVFPENAQLNYPMWMTPFFKNAFSNNELQNEMLALNEKAHVDLRVNTLKSSKSEVKKILVESGFAVEDCKYSSNGLRILKRRISRNHDIIANGLAEIQDEGSQLVAEICTICPKNTVVDFCAGAGGKTMAIAAAMKNKGRIFALDKYQERLENAKSRFKRANVNNVFCQQITGKWIKRHIKCADVVLVDAPCSGTGTWRRNPDMRAKFSANDLQELLMVQSEILESAHKLVKNGGKLVYSTCSVLKEENENQIDKFLHDHPEFTLQKINLQNYSGGYLKLTPYKHGTDGFFSSLLTLAD